MGPIEQEEDHRRGDGDHDHPHPLEVRFAPRRPSEGSRVRLQYTAIVEVHEDGRGQAESAQDQDSHGRGEFFKVGWKSQ